jgi:hypothetical protein
MRSRGEDFLNCPTAKATSRTCCAPGPASSSASGRGEHAFHLLTGGRLPPETSELSLTLRSSWQESLAGSDSSSDIPDKGIRLWLGRERAAHAGDQSTSRSAVVRRSWRRCTVSRPCSWLILSLVFGGGSCSSPGASMRRRTIPHIPLRCAHEDSRVQERHTAGPSASPDFLSKIVASVDFMRLSLRRAAYVAADRAVK